MPSVLLFALADDPTKIIGDALPQPVDARLGALEGTRH